MHQRRAVLLVAALGVVGSACSDSGPASTGSARPQSTPGPPEDLRAYADNEFATLFNRIPKYVASRGKPDLSWAGSTLLGNDLVAAVRAIRDRHAQVKVVGSLNLVQTLLREKLFDRIDLWLHPIMLGVGKKVFDDGVVPTNVALLQPPVSGPAGTVYLRYGLADGVPETGDMAEVS